MAERQPAIIAVMGMSGSGKSKFIDLASGTDPYSNDDRVSKRDDHVFTLDGRQVVLVEIPSYEKDSHKQAFDTVIKCLTRASKGANGIKLTGIIIMRPPSTPAVRSWSLESVKICRQICGTANLDHVTIVTTGFGTVSDETAHKRGKQHQLLPDRNYFRSLAAAGASAVRSDGNVDNAKKIIREMLKKSPFTVATDKPDDLAIIAVIGSTGVGKSSFINSASGSHLRTGHDLRSCTTEIEGSEPFEVYGGRKVILVDTPGFDDTTRSDTDILRSIAKYLTQTYRDETKLTGVIYMHRIMDPRVGGVARRNFKMFQKLCGTENFGQVTIVTTFWDAIDRGTAQQRQEQLSRDPEFFKPMLDGDAWIEEYDRTRDDSARHIVEDLVWRELPERLSWLTLQRQLGAKKIPLPMTDAGIVFNTDLMDQGRNLFRRMEELKEELKVATLQERKDLEGDRRELQKQMNTIRNQLKNLSKDLESQGAIRRMVLSLLSTFSKWIRRR